MSPNLELVERQLKSDVPLLRIDPLQGLLSNVYSVLSEFSEEISKLRVENDQLRQTLLSNDIQMRSLEGKIEKLEEELVGQGSVSDIKKEVNHKLRKMEGLIGEQRTQSEKLNYACQRLDSLEVTVNDHTVEIVDAVKKIQHEKEEVTTALKELDSLKKEQSKFSIEVEQRIKSKAECAETKELRETLKHLKEELDKETKKSDAGLSDANGNIEAIKVEMKTKVDRDTVFQKMGREEAKEVIEQVQNKIWDELGRQSRIIGSCRVDTTLLLESIQKSGDNIAAGSIKCLSCTKQVPMTPNGPQPLLGRSPITVSGSDGNQYMSDDTDFAETDANEIRMLRAERPKSAQPLSTQKSKSKLSHAEGGGGSSTSSNNKNAADSLESSLIVGRVRPRSALVNSLFLMPASKV